MKNSHLLIVIGVSWICIFSSCERRTTIIREETVVTPAYKEQPDVNLQIKGTRTGVTVDVDHKP